MMSWTVKTLLRDRYKIRSRIMQKQELNLNFGFTNDEYEDILDDRSFILDLEDDDYNDLLLVEKKINDLHVLGILSDLEVRVLTLYSEGATFGDIEKDVELSRNSIIKCLNQACNKIAFSLGDTFTNKGLAVFISEKYELTPEEIKKLEDFIYNRKNNNND